MVPIGVGALQVTAEELETVFPVAKVLVAVTTEELTVDATWEAFSAGVDNVKVLEAFVDGVGGQVGKEARSNGVVQ